jgi:hypothetical protein
LEANLKEKGWEKGARGVAPGMKRKAKELKRLRKREVSAPNRVWMDFQERKQLLVEIGYIAQDGTFNAGARILRHIQIEEIFTTELVLSGLVEEIEPDLLYGVFCAMTNNFAPTVRLRDRLHGEARSVAKAVNEIRYSDNVRRAERLLDVEVNWDPNLVEFGRRWAAGDALGELGRLYSSPTDISGQLISGFRRAKDLASQIRHIYKEEPVLYGRLGDLMKRVSRDEVEVVD